MTLLKADTSYATPMQAARWKRMEAELQQKQEALVRRDTDIAALQQQLAQQGAPLIMCAYCGCARLCCQHASY